MMRAKVLTEFDALRSVSENADGGQGLGVACRSSRLWHAKGPFDGQREAVLRVVLPIVERG